MDKKLFVHLQGGRKVSGILRGYDLFLNLVIDDALEETTPATKHPIGTVVIAIIFTRCTPANSVYAGHSREQRHIDGDFGGNQTIVTI